tara:strand:+ start:246 stop:695 length:450 start_codon:yes stop_codon:yes gene_type:complete
MNLVDLCKICGILFFVVMCWYFIFVVFKTNKDYLRSLAGMNVIEGFNDDQNTKLENDISNVESLIKSFREKMGLAEGGKEEQRKLIVDYLVKSIKKLKLSIVENLVGNIWTKGSGNQKALEFHKELKVFEDALTYFTEEQTLAENEGLI